MGGATIERRLLNKIPRVNVVFVLAGAGGIEPTLLVLETSVLPLNDAPRD